MAAEESVIINTLLVGSREFVAGVQAEVAALRELGIAAGIAGDEALAGSRKFDVGNQVLFTGRRLAYAGTLALVAAGAAAVKLGWNYSNAMQQARVALQPVFHGTQALNKELLYLYRFSSFTPFQFKDVTIAFRQLYASLKGAPGINNPLQLANKTIKSLTDALSFAGKTSPMSLNRVSLALQHMAYQGHLTGYAVNQLSRDGIPMLAILRKEFGLTGEQIHNIGKMNVPVQQVLEAVNKFIATTPGFANAAFRQATMTLHGAFTTFRDFLSQAVSGSQAHGFSALTRFFRDVDFALKPLVDNNKPITLDRFMAAIDQVLSPKTHLVLDFFYFLKNVLYGVYDAFGILTTAIGLVLWPLGLFNGGGKLGIWLFKGLGYWLGVYLGLMATFKIFAYAAAAAEAAWNLTMEIGWFALRSLAAAEALWMIAVKGYVFWTTIAAGITMWWEDSLYGFSIAAGIAAAMTWINIAASAVWAGVIGLLDIAMAGLIITVEGLTAAFFALDAIVGPLGWISLAVFGLIFLYQHWKPFRDIVDETISLVKHNWHVLADFFIPVLPIIENIYRTLKFVYDMIIKIKHIASGHGGGGWLSGWAGLGKTVIKSLVPGAGWIPHFATGGMMPHSGLALVGERGPEVVALPGGSQVSPMDGNWGGLNLSSLVIKIYPQSIYMDSQKIGTVMSTVTTDAEARQ